MSFMGSEKQPGVMRARKREILIQSLIKNFIPIAIEYHFKGFLNGTGTLIYIYSANLIEDML
jgi:hypothetical protein